MSFLATLKRLDDKLLLTPKILFFTMNLAYYSCYAFRAKYLEKAQGVSTKNYGILAAILSLVIFLGAYMWSYLVDRIGRPKIILIVCTVASALVFQIFLIKFPEGAKIPLSATISGLYIFFVSSLAPILDAVAMKMLMSKPGASKELYGRQRMWGTIAYAIISVIVSTVDLVPTVNYLVAILSINFAVVAFFLLDETEFRKKATQDVEVKVESKVPTAAVPKPENTKSPMIQLLTNFNFMFLLGVVFMNGLARATMTHFLEPIQRNVYQTPPWATGISTATGVFFEVWVFFFSRPLLRFFGVRRMLLISQLAMVLRISCYAFLPRDFNGVKYAPLFYELFKGVSFGFMQSAAVIWVTDIAPKELKSTAQALYTGVFSGFAAFAAGLVGFLVQSEGTAEQQVKQAIFLLELTAYISMFALAVFIVKYIIIDEYIVERRKKQQEQSSTAKVDMKN